MFSGVCGSWFLSSHARIIFSVSANSGSNLFANDIVIARAKSEFAVGRARLVGRVALL